MKRIERAISLTFSHLQTVGFKNMGLDDLLTVACIVSESHYLFFD
jgi:hypothetical protein